MTMPVPMIWNATSGLYASPRPSDATSVTAVTARIDTYGARWRNAMRANWYGKTPIRPIAKAVRVETFTPALALAIVEFTMARNTRTQNSPYRSRATPSQDEAPELVKFANLSGPKATSMA